MLSDLNFSDRQLREVYGFGCVLDDDGGRRDGEGVGDGGGDRDDDLDEHDVPMDVGVVHGVEALKSNSHGAPTISRWTSELLIEFILWDCQISYRSEITKMRRNRMPTERT